MKRLQHARPPTPEKSKKSSQDCEDLVGRRPLDYPEMLADVQRPAHRYHIHRRGRTIVNASTALLLLALFVSLPLFALFAASSDIPQQHGPIAVLISDIITEGVANKSDYTIFTKQPEDVYVCTHISCRQAEWIVDNCGYRTGVVMLWSYVTTVTPAHGWRSATRLMLSNPLTTNTGRKMNTNASSQISSE